MRHWLLNKWSIAALLLLLFGAGGGTLYHFFGAALLAPAPTSSGPQQQAVGAVVQHKGRVWSELDSSKRLLSTGSPVYQGDRIITGRHARLILKMSDDAIVAVGEDTELLIQEYAYGGNKGSDPATKDAPQKPSRGLLDLTKGFLRATTGALAKMDGQPFTVVTPVATMGVRGTEFWGRLHFVKNESTGDENPQLNHICMTPVCTVKNDSGEQVSKQPNLAVEVESKRKPPSKPTLAPREMLARAHLSTLVPPKLSAEAVRKLSTNLAESYQKQGIARTPEEAAKLVEASLERLVEKAEWDATEKAVMTMLEEKGTLSPAEIDAKLKQSLTPEEFDKLKQIQTEKDASLQSLQQELERRLADDLPADAAKEVGKILEEKSAQLEELKQATEESLSEVLDADKAAKILEAQEQERQQKQLLEEKLKTELEGQLSKELADKVLKMEEKLGATQPEKIDEVLRSQINNEESYDKTKTALEQNRAATGALAQETARTLNAYSGGHLGEVQQILGQFKAKQSALENLSAKRLKEVTKDPQSYNTLMDTLRGYDTRRAEIETKAAQSLKSTLSTTALERVSAIQASVGQAQGITPEEIQRVSQTEIPATVAETTVAQVVAQVEAVLEKVKSGNPDVTAEDIVHAVDQFLATEPEWKEPPRLPEPSREEVQAAERAAETDVVEAVESFEEATPTTEVDSEVVEQAPIVTTPAAVQEAAPTTAEASKTDEAPSETKETESAPTDQAATSGSTDTSTITDLYLEYVMREGVPLTGVFENSAVNTPVGQLKTNLRYPDQTYRFELVEPYSGSDDRFYINNDRLYVKSGTGLNYEASSEHLITVRAVNRDNSSVTRDLTVRLLDVNEAPTDIAILALAPLVETATPQVVENSAAHTQVATLVGSDADRNDTLTFTLTNDAQGRFAIQSTNIVEVWNSSLLNYETDTSHTITVRATDRDGLTYDESFTLNVTDINEPPTDIALDLDTVNENSTAGTVVGTFTVTDPDFGDSSTIFLTATAGDRFSNSLNALVVGNGDPINYEVDQSHTITVQAVDAGGLTYNEDFTLTVLDINEQPTTIDLTIDPTTFPLGTIPENVPNGTVVGTLSTIDPDLADTFTYEFLNAGDDGGGLFAIDGENLVVQESSTFAYDAAANQTEYVLQVTVTDHGAVAPQNLTLTGSVIIPLRPFDCQYIPDTPTVADMGAAGRTTYTDILTRLLAASSGASVAVSDAELENLIVAKVNQQLTSFNLTNTVSKVDVRINPTTVDFYTEVNLGALTAVGGLYTKLSSTAQGEVDTIFQTLAPYAEDYNACVRIRVVPTITGTTVAFAGLGSSLVDVHHDVDLLPNLQFNLGQTITDYNTFVGGTLSATDGIRFFTTVNSRAPLHILSSATATGGVAVETNIQATMTAQGRTPSTSDAVNDKSQSVPLSQNIDYYFPGMIQNIQLDTDQVILTR